MTFSSDIDECDDLDYDCGAGTCVNMEPSFRCDCPDGYRFGGSFEMPTCHGSFSKYIWEFQTSVIFSDI